MNAVTETTATELATIHASLDALLGAICEIDTKPRTRPLGRARPASEWAADVMAEFAMSEAQRFASRLSREPVREALCHAVRQLGRRLHEIGGIGAMHDAMGYVEDADPRNASRRAGILDKRWDGVGGWCA